MPHTCCKHCYAAIAMTLICSPALLAGQDFSALTALAEGALAGENVDQAVPGFEIRLLRDGAAIYHQAFGDWSLDQPARTDSSTKTLSGALMMSVAETGESGFSLDSRLSDFLSEYDQTGLRDITVRQAFSHTSGFASEGPASLILLAPNITLRRAAELISAKPLENGPPGSTFAYGGLSMHAAGAAAEVATGENYVDLFADRITTPLAMTNTQFVAASQINPRVAGGVESTATDYARFMDMLLNEGVDRATDTQVLSAASVDEMLSRQTNDGQPIEFSPTENHRYGIGVWVDQFDQAGPTVDALAGGARGFHSWIDQSQGLVFTFSTDLTTFSNVEGLSSLMHAAILRAIVPPGDFDFDGQVDGNDFLLWQRGTLSNPPSAADLNAWAANFGSASNQVARVPIGVPEPTSFVLLLAGLLTRLGCRAASGRNCASPCAKSHAIGERLCKPMCGRFFEQRGNFAKIT